MSEANKQVVRKVEEAWNRNDVAALDQYFARDFDNKQSGVPGMPPGLATAKQTHAMVMASFPDRKVEILDLIADGDKVMVRTRITGSNKGGAAWLGAPTANDKPFDIEAWSVYQLGDGKITKHAGLNDAVTLMTQLGILKPPM